VVKSIRQDISEEDPRNLWHSSHGMTCPWGKALPPYLPLRQLVGWICPAA